jgi:hypothetical protein
MSNKSFNQPTEEEVKIVSLFTGTTLIQWQITGRAGLNGQVVSVIPTKNDEDPDYKLMIIDIANNKVVYKMPAIPLTQIEASKVINTDNGYVFLDNNGCQVYGIDNNSCIAMPGVEGVRITAFYYSPDSSEGQVYFITPRGFADQEKWKGRSFMELYKELGGVDGDALFGLRKSTKESDETASTGTSTEIHVDKETIMTFMVAHPSLQNISLEFMGEGYIRLINVTGNAVDLPSYINRMDGLTSVNVMNNILTPKVNPMMNGGFLVFNVLDDEMNVVEIVEVQSPAYVWRKSIRGTNSDIIAALWSCLERFARTKFMNGVQFAEIFYIFKGLSLEKLNKFATGEITDPDFQILDCAPNSMNTNKESSLEQVKLAFELRLKQIVANFIFCLPPHQRHLMVDIIPKMKQQMKNVAQLVFNVRDKKVTVQVPKRIHDLTRIYSTDRDVDRVSFNLMLTERNPSLLQIIKVANPDY